MKLHQETCRVLSKNQEYLAKGDLKGFWHEVLQDVAVASIESSRITQTLLEVGVDPFSQLDYIPEYAFYKAEELPRNWKGQVPKQIKEIGPFAFSYSKISQIGLPEGLLRIEQGAFESSSLREIEIPASVRYFKFGAFQNSSLQQVSFAKGSQLRRIPMCAFLGTQLVELILPEGCLILGNNAVASCSNLKRVVLPESLRTIDPQSSAQSFEVIYPGTVDQFNSMVTNHSGWLITCTDGTVFQ